MSKQVDGPTDTVEEGVLIGYNELLRPTLAEKIVKRKNLTMKEFT
jgi:hypothetical protein